MHRQASTEAHGHCPSEKNKKIQATHPNRLVGVGTKAGSKRGDGALCPAAAAALAHRSSPHSLSPSGQVGFSASSPASPPPPPCHRRRHGLRQPQPRRGTAPAPSFSFPIRLDSSPPSRALGLSPPAPSRLQCAAARLRRHLRGLPGHGGVLPQPRRQDPQPRTQGAGGRQHGQRAHCSCAPRPPPQDHFQGLHS